MMSFPLLVLLGVSQALPCEYIIDPGVAQVPHAKLVIRFEARDGSAIEIPVETCLPGNTVDPDVLHDILLPSIEDNANRVWMSRKGLGNTLIVSGTRTSPIKSVTISSDGWKPRVVWQPILTKK